MVKIEASNQLNYEIGVMMFRAAVTEMEDPADYNVNDNFVGLIDELNEHFIFNKSTVLCGFENEYENIYGNYQRAEINDLFKQANEDYSINYEEE